jgi:ATP synthase protein I
VPFPDEGGRFRTVLRWQLYATAALMLLSGLFAGWHGALSALFGGLINVAAGAAYEQVGRRVEAKTAGDVVFGPLRAQGTKIGLTVLLLWLVLRFYTELRALPFFATFAVTVILFSMAFFAQEKKPRH